VNVVAVCLTARGRELARRLPWPVVHGDLGGTVRAHWRDVDGFVLFAATGIAVRVIGPLLEDKTTDPAVVCVDEAGAYAVALCGGHGGGANDLARHVAALLGATPVITTASDAAGLPALDQLPGLRAAGEIAAVTRALLDGAPVAVVNPLGWPLPAALEDRARLDDPARGTPGDGAATIVVTDGVETPAGAAVLHPPSLTVGVGAASVLAPDELADLAGAAMAAAGLARASVGAVATIDRRAADPAVLALAAAWGVPVRALTAEALAGVEVPNPSATVAAAVGTASVAEAAALLAGGPGAELVVTKQRSTSATFAVARRARPTGHLWVVGLGPGDARHRTPAATAAVGGAEVVIGYGPYLDLVGDAVAPGAQVVRSPIGAEAGRAAAALGEAAAGRQVALVCSGDAGIYGLASLVFELAPSEPGLDPVTDITVVPGVTAALAAAAAVGAPLGHDHMAISLSDLLTPWPVIERRLLAAAEADLVVSLYNPRSAGRHWQLGAARDLLAAHRPPGTPVGVVTNAGREGMRVELTTLAELEPAGVGMMTCVIIGSSSTRIRAGRMVTPRGYLT